MREKISKKKITRLLLLVVILASLLSSCSTTSEIIDKKKLEKLVKEEIIKPVIKESRNKIEQEKARENAVRVKVIRVVDGDTVIVDYKGKDERLRLIGVDTPESVHPDKSRNSHLGEIASDYAKKKLTGKYVDLEFDVQERDHYGRLLGYIYLDNKMFNKTLLEEGYAQISTYPPNVRYVDDFIKLEEESRSKNKGLWRLGMESTDDKVSGSKDKNRKKKVQNQEKDSKLNPNTDKDKINSKLEEKNKGKIKGNINSKGEKIYHIPGGAYYDQTKIDTSQGERWFKTEKEAQDAGWVKSKR